MLSSNKGDSGSLTLDKIHGGLPSLQEASGEDLASSTGPRHRRSSSKKNKSKTPFGDNNTNGGGDSDYDDLEKSSSSFYDTSNSSQKTKNKEDFSLHGSNEEGDVIWKSLVATILILIGTAAGFIFLYGLISGDLVTAEKFDDYTFHLEQKSQEKAKDMNAVVASWSVHASSYAILNPKVWPFHYFSHFDQAIMSSTLMVGHDIDDSTADESTIHHVEWVATAPLITVSNREEWEDFAAAISATNVDAEDVGGRRGLSSSTTATTTTSEQEEAASAYPITRVGQDGGKIMLEQGPGPYLPIFQMRTAVTSNNNNATSHQDNNLRLLNLNLLSIPVFERAYSLVRSSQEPVMSEPFLWSKEVGMSFLQVEKEDSENHDDVEEEPYTFLVNPIFGRHDDGEETTNNEDKDVVGVVVGLVPYKAFFENIIPQDMDGIALVIRPSLKCEEPSSYMGEEHSFRVDGHSVIYKGTGDDHDDNYDYHEKILEFDHFLSVRHHTDSDKYQEELTSIAAYCPYNVYIYPQGGFYKIFRSNTPRLFAGFLVGIFLFVVSVLNMYNCLVQRKQMQTHTEAKRSNAIVDMFFPEEVKQRLMDEQQIATQDEMTKDDAFKGGTPRSDDMFSGGNEGAKFLDDKPIASLFPACTVIFADIAGFTSWSSERSPEEVFILLETIYGEFDKIAKRRKVFKVETIGDCYLAVTGIPEPQDDHAVRMCNFARDCMMKMYEVTQKLEITLGPETSDLHLRIGCHSGPVTAGVLRGRKSHFQLFGDTVNTAARMESTGLREKIQVSADTAKLLTDSGRASWLKPRQDIVEAKGKGEMQTYWIVLRTSRSQSIATGSVSNSSISNGTDKVTETDISADQSGTAKLVLSSAQKQKRLEPKQLRLVQWNVELLSKLLKKVMAKQNGVKVDEKKLALAEQQLVEMSSILDEVKETIALSQTLKEDTDLLKRTTGYLKQSSAAELTEADVTIPEVVASQLTDYVTKVAQLHNNDNCFHNFEHASHVIMATSKLLKRIVTVKNSAEDKMKASTFNAGDVVLDSAKVHGHDTSYGLSNNPLCQFAVVFSALIHDVDHPGVGNAQLMKENEEVGRQYNNKSVAEQKSVDIAFRLLMQDEYKELRRCIYTNEKQLKQFRQLLVNSVIATDIFDHDHSEFRKERWALAFSDDSQAVTGDMSMNTLLDRKATIVIEHLIQASDVSHTMQHWHVYQKWNSRLFNEMYDAYKSGRCGTDPSTFWYNGELGFFDNYIIPLAQKLEKCGVFGVSSDEYLTYAQQNRAEWADRGEEIVASLVQKLNPSSELNEASQVDFDNKF